MKMNRIEGLCYTQLHIIHIVLGVNTVNTRVRLVRRYWLKRAVPTSVQMVAINTTGGRRLNSTAFAFSSVISDVICFGYPGIPLV